MPIQVQFHLQPPPLFCFLASLRLFLFHNQSACFICVCIIYYPVTLQSLHFVHFAGRHATHRLSKRRMLNSICSPTECKYFFALAFRFSFFVCEVMNFPTAHLQPFISFIGMISVCLYVLYYAYIAFRTLYGGVTAIVTWGTPESASW